MRPMTESSAMAGAHEGACAVMLDATDQDPCSVEIEKSLYSVLSISTRGGHMWRSGRAPARP